MFSGLSPTQYSNKCLNMVPVRDVLTYNIPCFNDLIRELFAYDYLNEMCTNISGHLKCSYSAMAGVNPLKAYMYAVCYGLRD